MKRPANRHPGATAGIAVLCGILASHQASAVPITATVQLTNGSLGTIDLIDSDTSSTAPVQASAFSTVSGAPTGIVLGQGIANGTPGGLFSVGVSGQDTHAHEAIFQLTEIIQNPAAVAQMLTLDFLITAGQLNTIVREVPPGPGGFLQAGYDIAISFQGNPVFQSNALLRQVGIGGFSSTATVTETGTGLGGLLTQVPSFADEYLFSWNDYAGTVDLGILTAGASGVLQYDIVAYVAAEGDRNGATLASIGDPFNVVGSPLGAPLQLTFTAPVSVPEPGTLALFGIGLLGFALRRRRRS